jgi:hypothetical protein
MIYQFYIYIFCFAISLSYLFLHFFKKFSIESIIIAFIQKNKKYKNNKNCINEVSQFSIKTNFTSIFTIKKVFKILFFLLCFISFFIYCNDSREMVDSYTLVISDDKLFAEPTGDIKLNPVVQNIVKKSNFIN